MMKKGSFNRLPFLFISETEHFLNVRSEIYRGVIKIKSEKKNISPILK